MKKTTLIGIIILSFTLLNFYSAFACEGTIQGNIFYSGGQEGKIIVAAFNFQLNLEEFDFEESLILDTLDAPGSYEFTALDDGSYLVAAFLDVNDNGLPGFTEPLGAYPAVVEITDNCVVTDVNIYLNELPRGSSSISGNVHYNGQLSGKIHVFALGLTGTPFNLYCPPEGENNYTIAGLMAGEYMVVAFLDVDDDGVPDIGEPVGFIQDKIEIGDSQEIPGQDITLFDSGIFSGSINGAINYSGSKKGLIYICTVGLTHTPITITEVESLSTTYQVPNLDQGEYYLFAYIDVDGDGAFTPMEVNLDGIIPDIIDGEPYEIIGEPIIITEGEQQEFNLTLDVDGDASISGNITYLGNESPFLVLVAALGLSPSWLGLGQATGPLGQYSYTIENLDVGLYGVIGIMITDFNGFDDLENLLKYPIGFYTKDLVCIKSDSAVTGIDFYLEDSTTATSTITGTITTPEGIEGEINLFSVGLSLTYNPHVEVTENTYTIENLRSGRYFIGGFIDVNGDGTFGLEEPFAFTESLVEIPHGDTVVVVDLIFNYDTWFAVDEVAQNLSPDQFVLAGNYPNPFNPTTNIQYQLAEPRKVSMKIYNLLGSEVITLINEEQAAGCYEIAWDGKNSSGNDVSSGVYLYSMQAGDFVSFKKMTLIR